MTDDLWDDHFLKYTNVESLCCTPETNIIVYGNYTSIKKKKDGQRTTGNNMFTRDLELLAPHLQRLGKKGESFQERQLNTTQTGKTHKFCLTMTLPDFCCWQIDLLCLCFKGSLESKLAP